MDEETHFKLLDRLTQISAIEADSALTFWNGVKIWAGNVEDPDYATKDYHLIIDTPEGNHYQILLNEDGTMECLTQSEM